MSEQTSQRRGRSVLRRGLTTLLAGMLFLLLAAAIFTAWYTQQTETLYPPYSFLTVDGVQLHYHEAGSGTPVLVIHGGGGNLYHFVLSPLYDRITADYRVIFVDRPCMGYSHCPDEDPTIKVQARLIHGLVEALDVDRPIIIGQSWGAGVAMAYAVAYPDDVSGIVMLGGHPYTREDLKELTQLDQIIDTLVQTPILGPVMTHTIYTPLGAAVVGPAILDDAQIVAPLKERPEPWRNASLRLALRPSQVHTQTWERYYLDTTLEEVMPLYPTVTTPILCVVGGLDASAYLQYERLVEDIPGTPLIQLDDAEHYLWFAYPQSVVDAVEAVHKRGDANP